MALCSSLQAKGLPVQTRSGQDLGRVSGFILDTERGCIFQIEVRPAGLVRGLVAQELLVSWNDVIEWTATEIIVQENVLTEQVKQSVPSIVPSV
jgi:sporulation protein YlmC with PRC-barrel domain